VIEWLLASGRDLGDLNKKGHYLNFQCSAIDVASKENDTIVVSLLERFIADPAQTRHALRGKLGVLDELAAEVFALTIFFNPDLSRFQPRNCHPLLQHYCFSAHRAADGPLSSCCGLNQAEYCVERFRVCFQISRKDSPF